MSENSNKDNVDKEITNTEEEEETNPRACTSATDQIQESVENKNPQVEELIADEVDKEKEEESFFGAKISEGSSAISIMCRICYDDTVDEPIISPCKCKGTIGMMHKSCLERWLAESNTNKCDLCFQRFDTQRTTKFSVIQSFFRWIKYPPATFAFPIRDMRSDMITCFILIPFSIMLIYLCLFAAEYYNRQDFSTIPIARWTAISVMFMGNIIILGFCTWMYLVLRYHARVWYFWWQRETIVRINFATNTNL